MRDSSSVLPLTGVVLFALAGCSSAGDGTADCGQQLRLDGVTYTGWSITDEDAQRFGEDSYTVFVAESLADADRDSIIRDLRKTGS